MSMRHNQYITWRAVIFLALGTVDRRSVKAVANLFDDFVASGFDVVGSLTCFAVSENEHGTAEVM